jgi:PAS domain S-box-containing protein
MSKDAFGIGAGSAYERLSQLSRQAEGLPAEDRALVKEILEAFSVSVEELQVAAEELRQQNEELSAAHTELEAQRRRYRDLFQFAPDGYLVSDPAAVIQEANQSAVDLLGASQGELAGKPLILYVSREQRDRFHRYLDRLLAGQDAGGRAVEWEMRIQPRRGPAFPAALTVASVRDGKGKLTGLRWLIHDITASKRAEERERLLADVRQQRRLAEDTNRLLQALIETMPTGAIIADADGNLLQTNAAGRSILGATVRGTVESPQRPYTTHYPSGAPLPPADMPLMRVLKEGQVVRDFEMLIRQPERGGPRSG